MDFLNITSGCRSRRPRERRARGTCAWSTQCTSPPVSSSTTTSRACTRITSDWLEQLAPHDPSRYRHNRTGEDNGDAHHKRQIMGREVVVAVTERQARFRSVGTDLLRRVRRTSQQARAGQGDRRLALEQALELRARVVAAAVAAPSGCACPSRPAPAAACSACSCWPCSCRRAPSRSARGTGNRAPVSNCLQVRQQRSGAAQWLQRVSVLIAPTSPLRPQLGQRTTSLASRSIAWRNDFFWMRSSRVISRRGAGRIGSPTAAAIVVTIRVLVAGLPVFSAQDVFSDDALGGSSKIFDDAIEGPVEILAT